MPTFPPLSTKVFCNYAKANTGIKVFAMDASAVTDVCAKAELSASKDKLVTSLRTRLFTNPYKYQVLSL